MRYTSQQKEESLLEGLCGFFQVIIFLYIIFWATHFGGWLVGLLQKTHDFNPYASQRMEKGQEWLALVQQKVAVAKQLGDRYTTREYFRDLGDAELYQIRYGLPALFGDFNVLLSAQGRYLDRHWNDAGVQELLAKEQRRVEKLENSLREDRDRLTREAESAYEAKLPHPPPQPWYVWIENLLVWLIGSYLRIAGLLGLFYVVSALGREKNCRSLRSLQRYLRAVIYWPVEVWKYPHDTWNEIRVEAEIRRTRPTLRSLLKPLTKKERTFVRALAADGQRLPLWLKRRQRHPTRWALGLTIVVVLLLLPFNALAAVQPTTVRPKGQAQLTTVVRSASMVLSAGNVDPPWGYNPSQTALPAPEQATIEEEAMNVRTEVSEPKLVSSPMGEIFHVPRLRSDIVV